MPPSLQPVQQLPGQLSLNFQEEVSRFTDDAVRVVTAMTQQLLITVRQAHVDGLGEAAKAARISFAVDVFEGFDASVQERLQASRRLIKPIGVIFEDSMSGVHEAVDKWIKTMDGVSSRKAANELFAQMIGPDLGKWPGAQSIGARGTQIRRGVQRIGAIKERLGVNGKSVYRRAQRILASEMQAMKHQSNLFAAAKSPATKFVKWTLSPQHAGIWSSPDVCDLQAYTDTTGAGPGLYRPESCPGLLHPFCACDAIPIALPPKDWRTDFGAPPHPRNVGEDTAKRILKDLQHKQSPKLTDNRLKRFTNQLNGENFYSFYQFERHGI